MSLLIKNIPKSLDYATLEKYVSAYARVFTLEKIEDKNSSVESWNALLEIPHEIGRLIMIELLTKSGCTISAKEKDI